MTKTLKSILLIFTSILVISSVFYIWYKQYNKLKLEKVYLQIDDSSISKLSAFRDTAKEIGYLRRSKDDYVNSNVIYRNQLRQGKARLKGDWLDHLDRNKWSFRIKLDSPLSDGLSVFSLQKPATRGYLKGYTYHKLLENEHVLSNEMRFIELVVNNESWGVYLLEEHLSNRMIKHQNKSDGLILKLVDQDFFDTHQAGKYTEGLIRSAPIKSYGKKNRDKSLNHFEKKAKSIIKAYQNQTDSVYFQFDSTKMAQYYAISDIARAYHAMGWINIRFYFNYLSQLMEPIGYDAYPQFEWGNPYLGSHIKNKWHKKYDAKSIVYSALYHQPIHNEYYKALNRVSDSLYIKQFFDKHIDQFKFYEAEIQKEYWSYEYDFNWLYDNAREIRMALKKSK